MSVHALPAARPSTPYSAAVSSPIPCPRPPAAKQNQELASSYPGAIKPVQLLQLQRRHVPHNTHPQDELSLFYNCTTPKHAVPPAPLHHTLELQDHESLLSATAPSHVHAQPAGWHHHHHHHHPRPHGAQQNTAAAAAHNWRQGQAVPPPGAAAPAPRGRHQGRVKWYNQQKKYGFIISKDSREYFVHRDDLKPANTISEPHLYTGEYVEYDPIPTEDGRLKASNVSGIEKGPLMCDHL